MDIAEIDGIGLSTAKKLNTKGMKTTEDVRNRGYFELLNIKYLGVDQIYLICQYSGIEISLEQIRHDRGLVEQITVPKTNIITPQQQLKIKINNNFELLNKNLNSPTAFVEEHFKTYDFFENIVLVINWEDKTAIVEVRNRYTSTDREYRQLDTVFELDDHVDATKFKHYYDTKMKSDIREIGNAFYKEDVGDRIIGMFYEEFNDDEILLETMGVEDLAKEAPKHNIEYLIKIDAKYDTKSMIEKLKKHNIDFVKIKLTDENINKIKNILEDGCIFANFDHFKEQLKYKQEELLEDGLEKITENSNEFINVDNKTLIKNVDQLLENEDIKSKLEEIKNKDD